MNKDMGVPPQAGSGCSAEPEPEEVSAETASIPNAKWPDWYRALLKIEGGTPQPFGFDIISAELQLLGFAESVEQKKPCRSCGQPVHSFRYTRITKGGRAFMDAAAQAIEARRAETPQDGSVHESAVAESDAPKGGPA